MEQASSQESEWSFAELRKALDHERDLRAEAKSNSAQTHAEEPKIADIPDGEEIDDVPSVEEIAETTDAEEIADIPGTEESGDVRLTSPPEATDEIREPEPPSDEVRMWYLRVGDGSVYGPIGLSVLCDWATQGRVVPANEVSHDGQDWRPAESIHTLWTYWVHGRFDSAPPIHTREPGTAGRTNTELSQAEKRLIRNRPQQK